MKRSVLAAAAFIVASLTSSSAFADTYFNFSFTGTTFSGSGQFDTVATATSGQYLIVGVTGTADNSNITGVLPIGAFPTGAGQVPNDNILLFPGQVFGTKFFDAAGVSFSLANGQDINLNDVFVFETGVLGVNGGPYTSESTVDHVSLAPTPEPGSLALLGTGVLGFAGTIRRRLMA